MVLKYCNVFINHIPVMTLSYFTARSTYVAHAFELGKLAGNGQMDRIFIILKNKLIHRAILCCLHVYDYYSETSLLVYISDLR